MNELDDNIAETYRRTNTELISMIKIQQAYLKRIIIALVILISVMSIMVSFISFLNYKNNQKWIDMWGSYEYIDVSTDGGGNANYIGEDGIITNGENKNCEKETISSESFEKIYR